MAFDNNTIGVALTDTVTDSYNDTTNTTNTSNATLGVADSLNETTTVSDSGNETNSATDSFHKDSYNTDIDVDDSFNETTTTTDASDNSQHTYTDNSDHSINAGVRSYSVGAGEGAAGAAAAGGGNATIVDQSLNSNVAAFGPVFQGVESSAVVASGADSLAAGDDIDIETNIDQSTNFTAGGDINLDNTTTIDATINSGNTYSFSSSWEDNSMDIDVDDSWNSYTETNTATDSFNDTESWESNGAFDVDVDAIVDSTGAAIGDVDIAL